MHADEEPRLLVEATDGVMTITLNSPQTANAIAAAERDRMIGLLKNAHADPSVRVVVLASTGKHFCAGANLNAIGTGGKRHVGDPMKLIMGGAQQLIASVLDCSKPVLAAVQGTAAGLGAHLAYAADLIVASAQASFIESFALRGLVVDAGGAYLLPRRIGLQKAKELAFLGDRLSAQEALQLGLVNRVVPPDELQTAVHELAGRLATAATSAIGFTKQLLNRSLDGGRDESFLIEGMTQEMQSHAHDSHEGVSAFKQRRDPQFTGW